MFIFKDICCEAVNNFSHPGGISNILLIKSWVGGILKSEEIESEFTWGRNMIGELKQLYAIGLIHEQSLA